jgi:hypothetical protein
MITLYWSRKSGKFVNMKTGNAHAHVVIDGNEAGPKFEGTVREWYETLVETMIQVQGMAADAGRTARNALVDCKCGPDVATIMECSVLFRPNYEEQKILCEECAKMIAEGPIGTLSRRFAITLDRDMPRNEILIGNFGKVIILDMNII